jgi:hypothetical protein
MGVEKVWTGDLQTPCGSAGEAHLYIAASCPALPHPSPRPEPPGGGRRVGAFAGTTGTLYGEHDHNFKRSQDGQARRRRTHARGPQDRDPQVRDAQAGDAQAGDSASLRPASRRPATPSRVNSRPATPRTASRGPASSRLASPRPVSRSLASPRPASPRTRSRRRPNPYPASRREPGLPGPVSPPTRPACASTGGFTCITRS